MTPAEIVISVIGLVAGYWLVSKFMEGSQRSGRESGPSSSQGSQSRVADDWPVVLGVDRNASREEISAAYKRKISQYHPDKVAQMGEEIRAVADAKSQEINAAYARAMKGP